MVVVDDAVYSSSSHYHHTTPHHRRFPSIPTIKEVPNRGAFNPTYHKHNAFESSTKQYQHEYKHLNDEGDEIISPEGKAPTIVSTIISPTVTRQHSFKKKKRYMLSSREVKNHFFYPVKAPRRKRSRRGKFRNSVELDASMNYVNIDSSMSKDLCLNQRVKAYEISLPELIKIEPALKETTKAITIDSNNNYIIYTPDPTIGKNSVISDAEQLLDQELLKLGTPITFNKATTPVLPQYKFNRPFFNRYDTYPIAGSHQLLRTRSLPSKWRQEGLQDLWNLYLRRVVAARIMWRLKHISSEPNLKHARPSFSSSVDTGFFINSLLKNNAMLPAHNSKSSSGGTMSDDEESGSDVEEPITDDDHESRIENDDRTSHISRGSHRSRESTQEVLSSLESLLDDMRSIIQ